MGAEERRREKRGERERRGASERERAPTGDGRDGAERVVRKRRRWRWRRRRRVCIRDKRLDLRR